MLMPTARILARWLAVAAAAAILLGGTLQTTEAAWHFQRAVGHFGRRLVYTAVLGEKNGWGARWFLTNRLLGIYSDEDGVISELRRAGQVPFDFVSPSAVFSALDEVFVVDNADWLVKSYRNNGDLIRAFTFNADGSPLICSAAAPIAERIAVAVYDFQHRRARVDFYTFAGLKDGELSQCADSPLPWDWIFSMAERRGKLVLYVYHDDGNAAWSWVEERGVDGSFLGAGLLRQEPDIGPLWYARRRVAATNQAHMYAVGPDENGRLTLYRGNVTDGFAVVRSQLDAVVGEPWIWLQQENDDAWIVGLWPDLDRLGTRYVFGPDGTLKQAVHGSEGPQGGLNQPQGVAVDPDGRLVAADTDNYRTVAFDGSQQLYSDPLLFRPGEIAAGPSGVMAVVNLDQPALGQGPGVVIWRHGDGVVGQLGPWGSGDAQLAGPQDVAWSASGQLFVADTLNDRVVVFDAAGNFLRSFGGTGEAPPHLYRPNALAVAGDRVFVAQPDGTRSRVTVFTTAGDYLRHWWAQGRIEDLAPCGDGLVAAVVSGYGVMEFNELGDLLDGVAWREWIGAEPSRPAALVVGDSILAVADTGNGRLLVFDGQPVEPTILSILPDVIPLGTAFSMTVAGRGFPADAAVTLQGPGGSVAGQVDLRTSSMIAAKFPALDEAGQWNLRVIGTGADLSWPVTVTGYVPPQLAGRWRGPDGQGDELTFTVSLLGRVEWRENASGRWRAGVVAAHGDTLTVVFDQGEPGQWLGTEAYGFSVDGERLRLEGLYPGACAGRSYSLQRLGGGTTLDPSISGVWRLVDLEVDGRAVAVDWTERMALDASGGFVINSNASGAWTSEAGRIEAAGGQVARVAVVGSHGTPGLLWRGTYQLTDSELILELDDPQQRHERWQRQRTPGARPLLWTCLDVPAVAIVGRPLAGRVQVANYGDRTADDVQLLLRTSWLGGPVDLGIIGDLAPGQTATIDIELPAPDAPRTQATVRASATCRWPERMWWDVSRTIRIASRMLDVGIAVHLPGHLSPGEQATGTVTVYSRAMPPSELLDEAARDEPALVIAAPGPVQVSGQAGRWDAQRRRWVMKWGPLADLLGDRDHADVAVTCKVPSGAQTGQLWGGAVSLQVPPGARDGSPGDDVAGWQVEVVDGHGTVEVAVAPGGRIPPGSRCGAQIAIRNGFGESVRVERVVAELPEVVEPAALDGTGWSLDATGRWAVLEPNALVASGQRRQWALDLRISPTAPVGSQATLWVTVYFAGRPPLRVASRPLVVGWLVGDVNRDGAVNLSDLVEFALGWIGFHQRGEYDERWDVAPTQGQWPADASVPDGQVRHDDAETMIDVLLRHGAPR